MEHPVPDFHPEAGAECKKAQSPKGTGLFFSTKGVASVRTEATVSLDALSQPRVRERIMKLSKVYSATCHHRYWSER